MDEVRQPTSGSSAEKPVPELLRDLSQQTATLVRKEMELARAELTQKGKAAGLGAGMFGAAGLLGLFAFGALTACFILALATAVDGWLAALRIFALVKAVVDRGGAIGFRKLTGVWPGD